ncbi:hypothetical protein KI387_036810, partial [Taxus chinensis]
FLPEILLEMFPSNGIRMSNILAMILVVKRLRSNLKKTSLIPSLLKQMIRRT